MNDKKLIIPKIAVGTFISIQIFAYVLSFLDILYENGTWQQAVIDGCYQVRNICFYITIISIVLFLRVKIDDIFLLIFFGISYLMMIAFSPQNTPYFEDIFQVLKYILCVYVAIRAKLLSFEEMQKIFKWCARFTVIILIITICVNTDYMILNSVYMTYANAISLGVALLLYYGIIENSVFDLIVSVVGLVSLLIFGSRGSLLTLIILALILLWIKLKNRNLIIVGGAFALVLVFVGPVLIGKIVAKLSVIGIDSRTVEKIINGNLLVSNDRLRIYQYLLNVFKKNIVTGVGICGDRYYLPLKFRGVDATYAHNFFIEIFLDYGLIFGILITCLVVYLLVKCLFQEKNIKYKGFFYVFFIVGFLQLMISRSWLTECSFFSFFALLMTYSTSDRLRFAVKYWKKREIR